MIDHSWRAGCPVPPEDLRLITLTHWDFSGQIADGELVVHVDQVKSIIWVMRRLFQQEFPIHRMTPIDQFDGDDAASMAANNTSAFNCREVGSQTGVWSQHAFGTAIDVNPVQNPYVPSSGPVEPSEGAAFLDRSISEPGMIRDNDEVVKAFAEIGWEWGGSWSSSKDYQHFSLTGR